MLHEYSVIFRELRMWTQKIVQSNLQIYKLPLTIIFELRDLAQEQATTMADLVAKISMQQMAGTSLLKKM